MKVAKTTETAIARPLKVLVPLIKEDLRQADEAAQQAGMPYYLAAGEKMLEAKPQVGHGQFQDWIKRNFGISKQQANKYMRLAEATAEQKSPAGDFSSLADFIRKNAKTESEETYGRSYGQTNGWHAPVKASAREARADAEALRQEELTRQQERDAQRKLALQLIEIGYKVLAKELHPDKGGSREAMARLNTVYDRLKAHV